MIPKDYRAPEDEEGKGGKKKKKRGAASGPKRRMRKAMKTMVGRKRTLGGIVRPGGSRVPGAGGKGP